MVAGREGIQTAYEQEERAEAYLDSRYGHPWGRTFHAQQARLLRHVLAQRPVRTLLEVAPGPARLTVYATATAAMYGVELSAAMLRRAQARVAAGGVKGWQFVRGDAFHLPLGAATFDFVLCCKLLRHFAHEDRLALLAEIRRVLHPGGHVLLDVVNAPAAHWLHAKWGVQESWIADYWFTEATFRAEMREAGFRVVTLHPVYPALPLQYYTWTYLSRLSPWTAQLVSRALAVVTSRAPLEWMALCAGE